MNLDEKYARRPDPPQEPSPHETIRFLIDEIQRRAYRATKGLTSEDLSADPGKGAWSIGRILKHQLDLLQFFLETLAPGSVEKLESPEIGQEGKWNLEAIISYRENLCTKFKKALSKTSLDSLMETPDETPNSAWSNSPILMRILIPLTDLSHHTGQVSYARRQFGKPVTG